MQKLTLRKRGITSLLTRQAIGRRMRTVIAGSAAAGCLCQLLSAHAAPGSWSQKKDIPAPTSTSASCVLDGILYVMGGHDDKPSTHALTNVWAYDPQTDFWTNRAPLPTARHFLGQCATAVDGIIYLVGGTGAGLPGPLVLEVAAYNPKTDRWTNGAPMPTGRGTWQFVPWMGLSMRSPALDTSHQTAAVEAYDPRSNHWTSKRSMPQARWFVTASVVNGLIYVFHGTDVFAYDRKTDSWTTKTNRFSPYSWGLMSAEVEGTIYLFGGFTQDWSDGNNFTLAYDPAQDQFTARRTMPGSVPPPPVGSSGARSPGRWSQQGTPQKPRCCLLQDFGRIRSARRGDATDPFRES